MFDNIKIKHDEKKDIYTINATFGARFKRYMEKNILNSKRMKQLFITYGPFEISFYGFFALEVRTVLVAFNELGFSNINVRLITKVIEAIENNTWLADMDKEYKDDFDYSIIKDLLKFSILEHQDDWFKEYNAVKRRMHYRGRLLDAAPGTGKALKFTTKVLTPTGWTPIYKLNVGDDVIGPDDTINKVTGVYPQGKRELFRFRFKDGRTIDADSNHLWRIFNRNGRKEKVTISTTSEIMDMMNKYSNKNLYIELFQPDFNKKSKDLLIDPYLLGYLIGNGSLTTDIKFSANDKFIVDKIDNIVKDKNFSIKYLNKFDYSIVDNSIHCDNRLKNDLEAYGLHGKESNHKFIPKEYLEAESFDRLELLKGLMDSDGTTNKDGSLSYSTTNMELANNIIYLVRSIGGMAYIDVKYPTYTHNDIKKNGLPNYNINIKVKHPDDLLSLPRKKDKVKHINQHNNNLKLRIESIDKLDKKYEAVCISVDHKDRLFVIENFVVTHNTFSSIATAELVKSNKILVVCPLPALDKVWVSSIVDTVYKTPQTYYVVGDKKKDYNGERYILCNYESLGKIDKTIPFIKGKDTTIIVDESHNMNETNSKRTTLLLNICNAIDSDNILLLSGTPIKARPLEMLPMIELLDKRFTSVIKHRFIKLYKAMPKVLVSSISERYTTYRTKIKKESIKLKPVITKEYPLKLKNAKEYTLDTIRDKMKAYITKRKDELTKDMLKYKKTYYDLYKKAKELALFNKTIKEREFKEYENNIKIIIEMYQRRKLMDIPDRIKFANKFENDIIRPLLDPEEKKLFAEAKTIVKYLNLKLQGEVLGNVVGRERINCHIDLANEIDYKSIVNSTLNKTIVFSNYVEVCASAYDSLNKIGYKPLRVYGEYTKQLNSTVTDFMVPKNDLNPLVATYKSLSTAVPLITANVMLCIDLPFREYVLNQAISRIHRLGQNEQVYVHQVQLDTGDIPNINSRNIDIIAWSADMVSLITGEEVLTEVIKNEGTDEGTLSVEELAFIDTFIINLENKKIKTFVEEKKIEIYDLW